MIARTQYIKHLTRHLQALAKLTDETPLYITSEALTLRSLDPTRTYMLSLVYERGFFQEYMVEGEELYTVETGRLHKYLKHFKGDGDVILETGDGTLKIASLHPYTKEYVIPLTSMEGEPPRYIQLDYTASYEVEPEIVRETLKEARDISDEVIVEAGIDGLRFTAKSEEGFQMEVEIPDEYIIGKKVGETVKTIYPVYLLSRIVDILASTASTLEIRLAQDYPMEIRFKGPEYIEASIITAPKAEV